MIDIAIHIILLSYCSSRVGIMLFDFLSYGEIFGTIKMDIAGYYFPEYVREFEIRTAEMTKSEAQEESIIMYDTLSKDSFIISLLDCHYCITIWVSLITAIIGYLFYDLSIDSCIMIPILSYHLADFKKN